MPIVGVAAPQSHMHFLPLSLSHTNTYHKPHTYWTNTHVRHKHIASPSWTDLSRRGWVGKEWKLPSSTNRDADCLLTDYKGAGHGMAYRFKSHSIYFNYSLWPLIKLGLFVRAEKFAWAATSVAQAGGATPMPSGSGWVWNTGSCFMLSQTCSV